jgi:hypothetical protein
MTRAAIPKALRTTPVVARLIPLTDVVTANNISQRSRSTASRNRVLPAWLRGQLREHLKVARGEKAARGEADALLPSGSSRQRIALR